MVSLIKSMKWDEEVFGLEYDLVRGWVDGEWGVWPGEGLWVGGWVSGLG
jgi:hypothetical protein